MCKDLVGIFKPLAKIKNVDITPCLPSPITPNYEKYKIIAILITLTWIILFLEPFSLRLRNLIMDHYYPERCKDRAIWLYQNLMTKRTSFFKYSRKKVLNKLSGKRDSGKSRTCLEIFRAKFEGVWICRKILGYNKDLSCVLCGDQFDDE